MRQCRVEVRKESVGNGVGGGEERPEVQSWLEDENCVGQMGRGCRRSVVGAMYLGEKMGRELVRRRRWKDV